MNMFLISLKHLSAWYVLLSRVEVRSSFNTTTVWEETQVTLQGRHRYG